MKAEFRKLFLIVMAVLLLLTGCAQTAADDTPDDTDIPDQSDTPTDDITEDEPDKEEYEPVSADRVFSLRYDPEKSLNPYTGANADNVAITGLMYEGLFSVDGQFNAEPLLCESWETSNGKVYSMTLKQGLTFSDGTPLTAKDVVYSITRARNGGRFMSRLSIVASTVAVGDYKVSITLSKPNYDLPVLLDVPIVKDGTAYDAIPVGTGPYYIKERMDGTRYLAKVENHRDYAELPISMIYLKTVNETTIVDEFSTRGIDLLRSGAEMKYNIHVESDTRFYDSTSLTYIGFNTKDTVMSNAGIRRALSHVIDRDYIYNEILGGSQTPAPLILSSVLDYYDPAWEDGTGYSLQKMSEIFATIGMDDYSGDGYLDYPIGEDNWRVFEVILIVNKENEERTAIAESVADSLRKVGINTVVQALPWAAYISALENGEFDIYIGEAQLQPDFDVSPFFAEDGELNYGKAGTNADYQRVIDEFLAAADEQKAEKAKALCDYVAADAAVIPIAYRRFSVVTHRDAVLGMEPSQSNIFRNITAWTIDP